MTSSLAHQQLETVCPDSSLGYWVRQWTPFPPPSSTTLPELIGSFPVLHLTLEILTVLQGMVQFVPMQFLPTFFHPAAAVTTFLRSLNVLWYLSALCLLLWLAYKYREAGAFSGATVHCPLQDTFSVPRSTFHSNISLLNFPPLDVLVSSSLKKVLLCLLY